MNLYLLWKSPCKATLKVTFSGVAVAQSWVMVLNFII